MSKERNLAGKKFEWDADNRTKVKYSLGSYIKLMRTLTKFSQAAAAKRAGISRAQWNRIENGHDLPRYSTIPAIADAIHIHPAALYTRAGYPLPEWEVDYDLKTAARDLLYALEKSTSLAGFLMNMQLVWQNYQSQDLKKNQRIHADHNYAEVFASVIECLNSPQQLKLARSLVELLANGKGRGFGPEAHALYDEIDASLEKMRRP